MNSSAPTVFASKGELVCRPVHWIDVVKFLVFNYVLHALTVLSSPGDGALLSTLKRIFSLFIPMFGTVRALTAIHRFACGESTPVQVALRARALCMIYDPGEYYESRQQPTMGRERLVSLAVTNVQGQHPVDNEGLWSWLKGQLRYGSLPASTVDSLITVPPNLIVAPPLTRVAPTLDLAYNYNIVGILAAIAQIAYASFQLAESSGPQIEKFGYAAYQLTVIPYTIMSVLNLLASLCEPEFPAMFLVRRDIDATGEYSELSGEVGIVYQTDEFSTVHRTRSKQNPGLELLLLTVCSLLLVGSIIGPYLLVWFLTHFRHGRDPGTVSVTLHGIGLPPPNSRLPVLHPWVVIWLGYSQFTSLCAFIHHMDPKLCGLPRIVHKVVAVVYVLFGMMISAYGFICVVRFMWNDTICIVI